MQRSTSSLGLLAGTLAWLMLGITAAHAPGSISLDEVMEQLKGEQKLIAEITDALKAEGLKPENVICTGARFGGHWVNLGGARGVPYECEVGKRTLAIDGKIHLYDKDGKELDMDDESSPENAVEYKQTDISWSWK
jgi:hypothetical protein